MHPTIQEAVVAVHPLTRHNSSGPFLTHSAVQLACAIRWKEADRLPLPHLTASARHRLEEASRLRSLEVSSLPAREGVRAGCRRLPQGSRPSIPCGRGAMSTELKVADMGSATDPTSGECVSDFYPFSSYFAAAITSPIVDAPVPPYEVSVVSQ